MRASAALATLALTALASRGAAQAAPAAPAAAAQAADMPESYRQVQLRALELQRHALNLMVDSMPERLLRDKVTPIQRDFAMQIMHAAGAFAFVVPMTLGVPRPQIPDTTASAASRATLHTYVNTCFDWAAGVLRAQSAADRARTVNLFGTAMPAWQLWDEMNQHTWWTAGQIVANFRKNGMAPPGFGFF